MKSFEEVYEKLENNEIIKEVWLKAKQEQKKANIITAIICLIVDVMFLFLTFSSIKILTIKFMMIGFAIISICIIDLIIGGISSLLFGKNRKAYKQNFKEIIIKQLMSNFYDSLEYFPEKQIPQRIYDEVGYNERYNKYYSDDYFEAKIDHKYDIEIAEVKTQIKKKHRNSRGGTYTTTYTIFNGLFGKIVLDKSIESELKITLNGKTVFNKNKLEMDSRRI